MKAKWVLMLGLMTAGGPVLAQDVAIAPPPREAGPPVAVAAVKNGYSITLNRASAELLRDALNSADEKQLAAALRSIAKDLKTADANDTTAVTLEMVAFVVSSQLPGFKKAFTENVGPHGAVITLTGLQTPEIAFSKSRPKLAQALIAIRAVTPLLPEDAKDVIEAVRAVGRTTPLFWKVEPRK